jgi:hypothetical protein
VALTAGQRYDLKLEYYENTGGAVMKLPWQRPGQTTFAVVPQGQLYTPPKTGDGLRATYFANMDLTGATVSRIDPTVNFNWGSGAPAGGIGPDRFSARWAGQVQAVESGTYTFRTNSDDGVRLWVDGRLLVDHWTDHAPTYDTGTITLQAGRRYAITLEYYENGGGAVMQLEWLRPGQGGFVTVPQANLFSGAG